MQWLKLYSEWAADPKVQEITEAMQRRHAMILCLRCLGPLEKLTDMELKKALDISMQQLEKTRRLFVAKGFIAEDWSMPKWEARQRAADPKAAERQRRHRRNVARDVTRNGESHHADSLPPRAQGRGEKEESRPDEGARAPRNVTTDEHPNGEAGPGPEYGPVRRLALELGGSEAWGSWVDDRAREGFPAGWIAEVLRKLSGRGTLRMPLARSILEDYRAKGGPDRRSGATAPPPAPVARPIRVADAVAHHAMWTGIDPRALTADEAKARSDLCPYCDGSGWARLFRRPTRDLPARHASSTTTYCLCPAGEWARAHTPEETTARVPDLAGVLAGRTVWTLEEPEEPPGGT